MYYDNYYEEEGERERMTRRTKNKIERESSKKLGKSTLELTWMKEVAKEHSHNGEV